MRKWIWICHNCNTEYKYTGIEKGEIVICPVCGRQLELDIK